MDVKNTGPTHPPLMANHHILHYLCDASNHNRDATLGQKLLEVLLGCGE